MHSYAISLSCLGPAITDEAAAALRDSRLRLAEISFHFCLKENEEDCASLERIRALVHSKRLRPASVHLPFCTSLQGWLDPASLDEARRKEVTGLFARLVRENADLLGPQMTLHASMEPIAPAERQRRLDQCRRSIEELLPLAQEHGFSINVEYLPRTCLGNCPEELEYLVAPFDPAHVGICMDVNHVMERWRQLPELVGRLAPRIRTFHVSDYDGVDEMHWFPGQGIIDWPAVMKAIRGIDHDVLLIYETKWQLGDKNVSHAASPVWAVRQVEKSIWELEHCTELAPSRAAFRIPGNE